MNNAEPRSRQQKGLGEPWAELGAGLASASTASPRCSNPRCFCVGSTTGEREGGEKADLEMESTCQPWLPSTSLPRALLGCLTSGDVARRAGCSVPWLGEGPGATPEPPQRCWRGWWLAPVAAAGNGGDFGPSMALGGRAEPKGVRWQQAPSCLRGCFYLGWKGMTQRDLYHVNDACQRLLYSPAAPANVL